MSEQKRNTTKNQICARLLAHVDAGKTTLSEACCMKAGEARAVSRRVDHQDAFSITGFCRSVSCGITIFSKQAVLPLEHTAFTLFPSIPPARRRFFQRNGAHASGADYAVLVISGTDGAEPHRVRCGGFLSAITSPRSLFINKMDLDGADHDKVFSRAAKSSAIVASIFTSPEAER